MAEVRNLRGVFRAKIDEGIYSFDIIVEYPSRLYSSLSGYCVANTRKDSCFISISEGIMLSEEERDFLGKCLLREAKLIDDILRP